MTESPFLEKILSQTAWSNAYKISIFWDLVNEAERLRDIVEELKAGEDE